MRNPYKAILAKHRRMEADFIRQLRISMYIPTELPPQPCETRLIPNALAVIGGIVLCAFFLIAGCAGEATASEYTDEQIVNAIYLAEGGKNAKKPYGILSVRCETEKECRKICFNTVKNNRKRYASQSKQKYVDYIQFLASRYAPIGVSNDPTGLNGNWERNVRYFLARSK